jgi:hypothetical protein
MSSGTWGSNIVRHGLGKSKKICGAEEQLKTIPNITFTDANCIEDEYTRWIIQSWKETRYIQGYIIWCLDVLNGLNAEPARR